jgi:L-ribulose-5-phosphate 3-epimerase
VYRIDKTLFSKNLDTNYSFSYHVSGRLRNKILQPEIISRFNDKKDLYMQLINQIGCSTNCYHGFDLDTALQGIAYAGFGYVELTSVKDYTEHVMPELMTLDDRKALLAKLKSYGLIPMSLSGHSDLTSRKGIELLEKRIDFAKEIDIGIVNTGPGAVESDEGRERFFINIYEIAEYAADAGVTVALETHGELISSGEAGAEIIEKINSPWIRINYDTGNVIFYGGVRPEEDIVHAFPYLAHIHLKDKRGGAKVWDFPPIGKGDVDFTRVLKTISDGGYKGPISVEIEVLGKDFIPTWLVCDENGEIVSEGKKQCGPDFIDRAIVESIQYLKSII